MNKIKTETIIKKLEQFLSVRKESENGGFAEVTEEEIGDLFELFRSIIKAKYDCDADGDVPVNVHIIDRTRFEPQWVPNIPYSHKIDKCDYRERMDAMSTRMALLMSVADKLRTDMAMYQFDLREESNKKS